MEVKLISADRDDVKHLLKASDDYMRSLYPDESNHMESVSSLMQADTFVVGAFSGDKLAGMGAVKVRNDESQSQYGEIKRVYVPNAFRGQGVSKKIMAALHQHLVEQSIDVSRLETGISQPEAIGLYEVLGYTRCAPFGDYKTDPLSIFMECNLCS